MLEQIRFWKSVKVLFLYSGVRNDSVLLTEDPVDNFCVGVGKIEYPGGLVTGQAELSDQDQYL